MRGTYVTEILITQSRSVACGRSYVILDLFLMYVGLTLLYIYVHQLDTMQDAKLQYDLYSYATYNSF